MTLVQRTPLDGTVTALAIGSAQATDDAVALGSSAQATGTGAIAIGKDVINALPGTAVVAEEVGVAPLGPDLGLNPTVAKDDVLIINSDPNVGFRQRNEYITVDGTNTISIDHHMKKWIYIAASDGPVTVADPKAGAASPTVQKVSGTRSPSIYSGLQVRIEDDNIGLGKGAQQRIIDGDNNNIAIGEDAQETALVVEYNIAIGQEAQRDAMNAHYNVAIGHDAQRSTSGDYNIAIGDSAQQEMTTGQNNIAIGYGTQEQGGLTGFHNIAIGSNAQHETGPDVGSNIAIGLEAQSKITFNGNVGVGPYSQYLAEDAQENTAVGSSNQTRLKSGKYNVAVGYLVQGGQGGQGPSAQTEQTLNFNGESNVGLGHISQVMLEDGNENNVIGHRSLNTIVNGSGNIAIGANAQSLFGPEEKASDLKSNSSWEVGWVYKVPRGGQVQFDDQPTGSTLPRASSGGWYFTPIKPDHGVTRGPTDFAKSLIPPDTSNSIAIGNDTGAFTDSIAFGSSARAFHTGSVALGKDSVTTADNQVMVGGRDIEITDATKGVVLVSPNGTRYRATVDDAGALQVAAA